MLTQRHVRNKEKLAIFFSWLDFKLVVQTNSLAKMPSGRQTENFNENR